MVPVAFLGEQVLNMVQSVQYTIFNRMFKKTCDINIVKYIKDNIIPEIGLQ